jgi:hypothetical protein
MLDIEYWSNIVWYNSSASNFWNSDLKSDVWCSCAALDFRCCCWTLNVKRVEARGVGVANKHKRSTQNQQNTSHSKLHNLVMVIMISLYIYFVHHSPFTIHHSPSIAINADQWAKSNCWSWNPYSKSGLIIVLQRSAKFASVVWLCRLCNHWFMFVSEWPNRENAKYAKNSKQFLWSFRYLKLQKCGANL